MNVREQHIEVNQSLQKVAANRTRKFLSQEVDWVLNKMVNRFVQSKLRPRPDGSFELDELDTDAVRTLLVVNKELPAYRQSAASYVSFLPPDYKYLISDASFTQALCGQAATIGQVTVVLTTLRQERSQQLSGPYYGMLSMVISPSTLNIPGDLPYSNKYAGFNSPDDVSFLTPFLLKYFRDIGWLVYWERFADVFRPQNFIVVSDIAIPVSLVVDNTLVTQTSQITKNYTTHTGSSPKAVANRLIPSSKIQELLGTAFFKTSVLSPISELSGNNLYVYADDSFIVTNTRVTYIKEPQVISLDLGTDCDLAADFHQTICDLAVEYLKGRLENQVGTSMVASDNDRRVIL